MDKMKLAHEWALVFTQQNKDLAVAANTVSKYAFDYADAMQDEADKREKEEAAQKRKEMREMLNAPNTFIEREGQHFDDLEEWQPDTGKDRWTTSFKVAVDLVSDAGIEYAKFLLEDGNPYITVRLDGEDRKYIVFADDLKRLVDSHAVVEQSGGLEKAKKELQQPPISEWMIFEQDALRQAIADVERTNGF